jgi:SAM-dependent methyltransferase
MESAIYFAKELRHCGFASLANIGVVELGFGNGAFAAWASAAGARYVGVEAIPELVQIGRSAGFNVVLSDQPLAMLAGAMSADLIVAFDVFEHLETEVLRQTLEDCRKCLRKGGRIVGRVPSGDSPFARAVQHGDLTHRTVLGSSSIRQLAEWTGFEVASIRSPVLPLRGAGAASLLRRMLVSTTRALTYPVIAKAFMNGGRPVLTPNLLFVFLKT